MHATPALVARPFIQGRLIIWTKLFGGLRNSQMAWLIYGTFRERLVVFRIAIHASFTVRGKLGGAPRVLALPLFVDKGLSLNRSLVAAQNQAAVSGLHPAIEACSR
jgi:hypothetical protein